MQKIFECFNGDYMVTVDISLVTVDMATEAFNDYSVIEAEQMNILRLPVIMQLIT